MSKSLPAGALPRAALLPAATLRELFLQRCAADPARLAYAVLRDDLEHGQAWTLGELQHRVHELAAALRARLAPGERVLLVFHSDLDAVCAFWACVVAELVPVPAPAPEALRALATLPRLRALALDAQAAVALSTSAILAASPELADTAPGLPWLALDAHPAWPAPSTPSGATRGPLREPAPGTTAAADRPAYLQYTSGSTALPRGVVVTHANALSQCAALEAATALSGPMRSLMWLPYFHDYGLLHGILMPLYTGSPSYLMRALTVMRRPLRWLEACERWSITHTGAPDSAYLRCVQALAEPGHAGWHADLSGLRVATCGAEPIQPETLRAFVAAFAPHGLPAQAFTPAYGLAEAVLGVTAKPAAARPGVLAVSRAALARGEVQPLSTDSEDVQELVSCGQPLAGMQIRICAPLADSVLGLDRLGEVCVAGPCVSPGYWNEQGHEHAVDPAAGPRWLRTGDLGFLHGGELYISGRLKDLLVVQGRKLHAVDLEWTAGPAHAQIRPAGVAAFPGRREADVVLAVELERRASEPERAAALQAVRLAVAEAHEIEPAHVLALAPGTLPRTSSGKLQRTRCRELYLAGAWGPVPDTATATTRPPTVAPAPVPRDSIEALVADIWREVLGPAATAELDFFRLGGSSLLATQMVSRLNAVCGTALPLRTVFEHPALPQLARCVAAAQGAGRAGAAPPHTPSIPATWLMASRGPASYAQQRIWFMQRVAPQSWAYHLPLSLRLHGPLDGTRLQAALDALVARHAGLRTAFVLEQEQLTQIVRADVHVPLQATDLSGLSGEARRTALDDAIGEAIRAPFDLGHGPLMRASVFHLGAPDGVPDNVLLLVLHHLVCDQWAYTVLARDLGALYSGSPLPPQPGPDYLAYTAAHRAWFEAPAGDPAASPSSERERQLSHWRERLAGLVPLALPTDRPRPRFQRFEGARVVRPFDPRLATALTELAGRQQATLSMLLLAAFQALLHRYSGGQEDIAVGMPVANRHHLASEHLVGTLVNTLVLRSDLSGDPGFAELLARVRETCLQAYAHQDLPFDLLVHSLNLPRDPAHSPLFDVLFNVLNTPLPAVEMQGLQWEPFELDRGAAQFDLSVTVDPAFAHQISIEYATSLFEHATIERLADRFLAVLRAVLVAPAQRLSALPLLLPQERDRLLDWNATARTHEGPATVHGRVRAQALLTPQRTALRQHDASLSYAALQARADAWAVTLRKRSIGRGERVALALPRGPEMVAALLGVLQSGAAYVPLDPCYPPARLAAVLGDAQPAALITGGAPLPEGLALDPRRILHAPDEDAAGPTEPSPEPGPSDPAYVIYTSGSTGQPKGVAVPHGAVVNFLASMRRVPGLDADDRLLAVTTLSFDIAVLELLLPLTVGAEVVIARRDEATDGQRLAELIGHHAITALQATPSSWRLLLEAGWQGRPGFKALVGGEPLPADLADRLQACCAEVWNLYGPTETTVWSTCWRVAAPASGLRIGRPIANTSVWVVDDQGRLCPPGVPGEILIGGTGVALGYWQRPELTRERFVPDPFTPGANPTERLYRTGDLGRWRADGTLEHLGRLDHQVKVRGYRIELGDIEATLLAHPAVAQAVAATWHAPAGDTRLVAYCVSATGTPPAEPDALRAWLRSRLPEYMVPPHVVWLPALPLLPNGKVDRRALPAPDAAPQGPATASATDAPGTLTTTEQLLAGIWAELLGVSDVAPHDNFFDLGGHSLLVMQAIARMQSACGKQVDPRHFIFETLGQLAASYDRAPQTA